MSNDFVFRFFLRIVTRFSASCAQVRTAVALGMATGLGLITGIFPASVSYAHDRTLLEQVIADHSLVLELDSSDADAYWCRGVAKRYLKDTAGALADFDQALLLNPAHARALADRALLKWLLHHGSGNEDGAQSDYAEALRLDRELVEPDLEPAARFYRERGLSKITLGVDVKGAVSDFGKVIRLAPAGDAYVQRAWARLRIRDYMGAVDDYAEALALSSERIWLYEERGDARTTMRDFLGAESDYTRALELTPLETECWLKRGAVRLKMHDNKGAGEDFEAFIKVEPRRAVGFWKRGVLKLVLEDFEGALEDCNRGLELEPQDAFGYLLRGEIHEKEGQNDAALRDYERASALDPKSSEAFCKRASLKDACGDLMGALEEARKACELGHQKADTYLARAGFLFQTNDLRGAQQDCATVLEADPWNSEAYCCLAAIHLKKGERHMAADAYGKAVRVDPWNVYPRYQTWALEVSLGLEAESAATLLAIVKLCEASPEVWATRIGCCLAGLISEEELFERTHTRSPMLDARRRCEALYYMGMKFLAMGDRPKAGERFGKALDCGVACLEAKFSAMELERLNGRKP